MTDYVIQKGDTSVWALAVKFTGKGTNWPAFCKANPQLKKDPTAGCLFYVGKSVHLPDGWGAPAPSPNGGGSPPAPMPGPVPQPIGPPAPTPGPDITPVPPGPAPSPSLIAGLDPKKVMIGGAVLAGAIVLVYAMKKKTRAQAA